MLCSGKRSFFRKQEAASSQPAYVLYRPYCIERNAFHPVLLPVVRQGGPERKLRPILFAEIPEASRPRAFPGLYLDRHDSVLAFKQEGDLNA